SGFNDDDNIMVMGATNFSEVIDPALLRSGRFSRQITIDYPNDDLCQRYSN
ncbi:MAG: AAA family ATPase, partial [Bacteroidaceae bacterium]|nr:AAA family ATPase [Bacteroidaceae bacterium]